MRQISVKVAKKAISLGSQEHAGHGPVKHGSVQHSKACQTNPSNDMAGACKELRVEAFDKLLPSHLPSGPSKAIRRTKALSGREWDDPLKSEPGEDKSQSNRKTKKEKHN